MKIGVFAAAALAGAIAAGCQGSRQPGTVAFSAEEAAFIRKPGSGAITGHAFRTKPSGAVVNAAGQVVRLIPDTAFSRERFANLYGKNKYLAHRAYPGDDAVDPAYTEFSRTTKAGANGRFSFEKVPPGSYFVVTQVTWGDENAFTREGGSVYDTVTLTGRETEPVQVVLSGN